MRLDGTLATNHNRLQVATGHAGARLFEWPAA